MNRPTRDQVAIFSTSRAFRGWLEANHATAAKLWVGFYKKGVNKKAMTYPEAVEEGLSYGWIDSLSYRIDDEIQTIRFTPRRKGSNWSATNIAKVAELTTAGRMHPAGIKAFEEGRLKDR